MREGQRILIGVLLWTATITGLHFRLNLNWSVLLNDRLPESHRKIYVAYIPVT
ncbi:MAG TPA: hypothetical protein VGQ81_08245 [Acidobacteriota bacterium]|jgi:hypothetical protein|nr:hypothetical protein [Acidobacteriota bacterium]